MSLLNIKLGYGRSGTIELDCFTRMLNNQIYDNEEIRKAWSGNYEFMCLAPIGSSINDPVWNAIRITWINGKKARIQFQENMSYADITNGWIL